MNRLNNGQVISDTDLKPRPTGLNFRRAIQREIPHVALFATFAPLSGLCCFGDEGKVNVF